MTQKKAIIVKSPTPPTNTEVLWQDLSSDPPQLKSFINGGWKQLNSESTEVTDLRNELNASINEVNSTLNDKIDTNASTLNDKIDASIDVLNDKIDDEIAAQTETSQGIQEDLDGTKTRVATLENTYEDTMNIANQQINELVDGKAQIAQALTDRGYPTQATDSSASMAQKIENMAYDAGWLAQLGYTEQNDGGVKEATAYSKSACEAFNRGEILKFENNVRLRYVKTDINLPTDCSSMFSGCVALEALPKLNTHFSSVGKMFYNCSALQYIPKLDTSAGLQFSETFRGCKSLYKIEEVDFTNKTWCNAWLNDSGTSLRFLLGKGLCTLSDDANTSYQINMFSLLQFWGADSEENRQSLVGTLLTYSFDRATAGYSASTIKLHADTLARLTAEEIAAITAKGFTLTS